MSHVIIQLWQQQKYTQKESVFVFFLCKQTNKQTDKTKQSKANQIITGLDYFISPVINYPEYGIGNKDRKNGKEWPEKAR